MTLYCFYKETTHPNYAHRVEVCATEEERKKRLNELPDTITAHLFEKELDV